MRVSSSLLLLSALTGPLSCATPAKPVVVPPKPAAAAKHIAAVPKVPETSKGSIKAPVVHKAKATAARSDLGSGSIWFRFPARDKALNNIVSFMTKHSGSEGNALENYDQGDMKVFCIEHKKETEYAYFLFSHYAHADADADVKFLAASTPCNAAQIPSFETYQSGSLNLPSSPNKVPNFVCEDQKTQKPLLVMTETAENEKSVTAAIDMPNAKSDSYRDFAMENFTLETGDQGQPVFKYGEDESTLTLNPYQGIGDEIYGHLTLDDMPAIELKCKITN